MEHHEIVIVGAGPAGLKAAEVLAAAGKDVLVLEKNDVVGPKVCAGGISVKCKDFGVIPDDIIGRTFSSFRIETPYQKMLVEYGDTIIYTVDRRMLGEHMLMKATNAGAKVRTNMFVNSIGEKYVVCGDKKIGYDYLIGADGSSSVVRKYLGLKSEVVGLAIQYIVPGNVPTLDLYFDRKKFGSWYSWIFPNDGFYSIGVGAALGSIDSSVLRQKLDDFCKEKGIDVANSKFQAALINADYRGFKFDNIYLVGDAAGLAFGFSGEGIYSAIVSGELAAKSIIDKNFEFNDVISSLVSHKKLQESFIPLVNNKYLNRLIIEVMALLLRIRIGKRLFLSFFA